MWFVIGVQCAVEVGIFDELKCFMARPMKALIIFIRYPPPPVVFLSTKGRSLPLENKFYFINLSSLIVECLILS